MKKTYITPATEVITLAEKETLLAGSPDGFNNDLGTTTVDGGNALEREDDDLWED
jgi:hypothetical protein